MSITVHILRIRWRWIANIESVEWPAAGPLSTGRGVQFLQMHNGVGKTTTLYLLRSLFTGLAPDTTAFARARYKGPMTQGDEVSEIAVDVEINGAVYMLGLRLWPLERRHDFFTVAPRSGREPGWHPPSSFRSRFEGNNAFAQLFLFDTQLAGAMTESLPATVVDRAILEVANLGSLSALISSGIDQLYVARLQAMDARDGERLLQRTRNAISKLESIRDQRISELAWLQQQIATTKAELGSKQSEREALEHESVLREKLETINAKIQAAKGRVNRLTSDLARAYLEPSNLPRSFWSGVVSYYSKLESLRIPEVIAREVVEGIIEDGVCICGEALEPRHVQCLEAYKDRMTGATVVQEIFHIKDSVRDSTPGAGDVDDVVTRLSQAKTRLDEHKNHYRRVLDRLDSDVQERIDQLDEAIAGYRGTLSDLEDERFAITCTDAVEIGSNPSYTGRAITSSGQLSQNAGDYKDCQNLFTIRRAIDVLSAKEAAAAGAAKMRRAHELAKQVLETAFNATLASLKGALCEEANLHLPRLQTTGMRIHSFDDGMVLEDRQGQIQRGTNTGGELSAQYSFLMALRCLGEIDVPMVIDNPTKGLDGTAVSAFQSYLPRMFDQCLMLIYPMEKASVPHLIAEADHLATLHRADEEVSGHAADGAEAVGPMIVTDDLSWFVGYDPPSMLDGD